MSTKTLDITDSKGATDNIDDLKKFGDPDTFTLLCKASSEKEGWMKSTKVANVGAIGCLVQVTTQQRNLDGSYAVAEALTFVPGAHLVEHGDGRRELVATNTCTKDA